MQLLNRGLVLMKSNREAIQLDLSRLDPWHLPQFLGQELEWISRLNVHNPQ
jgi:hypothetical protein